MGFHLRVTCADPKFLFFTINVIEHGNSGVKICLYDHLSVSPAMAVGMDAPWKGRVQGPLSQFDKPEPPVDSVIILPAGHKRELHHSLFNYIAEPETNPILMDNYTNP